MRRCRPVERGSREKRRGWWSHEQHRRSGDWSVVARTVQAAQAGLGCGAGGAMGGCGFIGGAGGGAGGWKEV